MSSPTHAERPARPRGTAALHRLVFGSDAATAARIRFGMFAALMHLLWALFYTEAARGGSMSAGAAAFMIGTNLVGMLAFYPFVRCGLTRPLRDSGLVLPQMLWATASTIAGMVLAPTLRPPLLQVLCMTQLFGFFNLRGPQLLVNGGVAIGLLAALFGFGAAGLVPGFDAGAETIPILLTGLALVLLTRVTVVHSQRRGLLITQRAALAEAVAAVQALVVRDALTGLYNRRHMESLLAQEHARSLASGAPFSVALLDVDHFKRINDGHGHAVGDAVLRDFATAIGAALRSGDTVARWGGEEFLVLAPGRDTADPGTLRLPLERLRAGLAHPDAAGRAELPRITFSAGLAAWRRDEPAQQTVARADAALYAAKAAGRDRLMVHDGAGPRACIDARETGEVGDRTVTEEPLP